MPALKSFYDRLPNWIQWFFWCCLVLGVNFLSEKILKTESLSAIVLAGLGTAIFLFLERPLVLWGASEALETGIAAVLSLLFIFHLSWTYLAPKLAQEELYSQACNPASYEMRCYLFSRENCLAVWNQYYEDCRLEVKKNQDPSRLSSLLGPATRLCTQKKFDKSFQSTRKMDPPPECHAHFEKLDAPSL